MNFRRAAGATLRTEVWLFVFSWILFGVSIRSTDLELYNLQQMGVDAIVEHGTFSLGHSRHPLLQPTGDVFRHDGTVLAAKQPGQFVFGALAYAPLHALGITYDKDYLRAAAWVTWLSSASFAALAVALMYALCHGIWGFPRGVSLFAAIGYGFGTPVFAYAGVAHHDVIASALTLAMFVSLERARKESRATPFHFLIAGLCGGLALFTSMLPAFIVLVLLLYAGYLRGALATAAGFALGLTPLAIYNRVSFGSPFTQANVAGHFADTFFRPTAEIFLAHLWRYLGLGQLSLLEYAPVAMLGLVAVPFLLASHRRVAIVLILATVVHLGYVLNIESFGHCQFGPRYLLPLLSFLTLAAAMALERAMDSSTIRIAAAVLLVFAIAIGATGALMGTMNCDLSRWLPLRYWSHEIDR